MESKAANLLAIKLLVTDVDGTLTNGKVYYSKDGEELKIFSIRDGMGFELLKKAGIKVAILTSEESPIVVARAKKLKIEQIVLGSRNKKASLIEIAKSNSLALEEIAYIGDDVNDLQAMELAGYSACPSDSVESIKEISDYICSFPGGEGAVREFIELILKAQDKPITLQDNW